MSVQQTSFLFHDYETFGQHPALDKPAQFAAIRTDADFNILGEPEVFYCKPPDDYLPQPEAVLITGITPQYALKHGENEATFARRIHALFSTPHSCILGYNNIRFDDEVTRNIFYRNFYDPYAWSWRNGNSRWDLLDVVRACYALRPQGIHWPENDEGFISFRLEHLTQANGIKHSHAHDATADVYATIEMAKLIRHQQPRLFHWLFQYRLKNKLATLIDVIQMKPLVHVSGMLGAWRGNTSWIVPVAWHPLQKNSVITVDLAGDMTPLFDLDAEALRQRLYTRKEDLNGNTAVPVKLVHLNKCPILAPANTLSPEDAQRLGIDRQHCLKNLKTLQTHPELRNKLVVLFENQPDFPLSDNIDTQLYRQMFSDADRQAMDILLEKDPKDLPTLNIHFNNQRIPQLLFNYRARNFPGTLDEQEQQRWLAHRRQAFSLEHLQKYSDNLALLYQQYASDSKKLALLIELEKYLHQLIS